MRIVLIFFDEILILSFSILDVFMLDISSLIELPQNMDPRECTKKFLLV